MRLHYLVMALLLLAAPAAAATDAATIVRLGNGNGAAPCMVCHGTDGGGDAALGYPRLAGLNAAYIQRQLDDIADGTRKNAMMQPTASALSEDERAQLAKYYSALPIPTHVAVAPPPPADGVGARLATRGDWSRGLPACTKCHGPGGVGVGADFPPLAGQSAVYITSQLRAWQQGTRRNDPLQLMQHVAKRLTPEEVDAVAAWFAGQPSPAAKGAP